MHPSWPYATLSLSRQSAKLDKHEVIHKIHIKAPEGIKREMKIRKYYSFSAQMDIR